MSFSFRPSLAQFGVARLNGGQAKRRSRILRNDIGEDTEASLLSASVWNWIGLDVSYHNTPREVKTFRSPANQIVLQFAGIAAVIMTLRGYGESMSVNENMLAAAKLLP